MKIKKLSIFLFASLNSFVYADDNLIFRQYAIDGNVEGMQAIYAKGTVHVDAINNSGQSALHLAAMFGKEDAVKFLLAQGANRSLKDNGGLWNNKMMMAGDFASNAGQTPLDFALTNGHFSCAALIDPFLFNEKIKAYDPTQHLFKVTKRRNQLLSFGNQT